MKKEIIALFEYLERDKGIKREVVIKAIKDSLHAAARKSVKGHGDNISVDLDPKTGDLEIFALKKIVDKVTNPQEEISIEEALELEPSSHIGQTLGIPVMSEDFGRIAAQAARQLLSQKIKGAERDVIYSEYRHRVGQLVSGTVKQFIKGRTIVVDIGKITAILLERNYPKTERYNIGDKVQALLLEVKENTETGGADVILSRSHKDFVSALFTQEVPELHEKTVVIEKIERDAGYRTKLAVRSFDPKVDPVGTCVGVKGSRIKHIIADLNGEKIDVIPYIDDEKMFLEKLVGKSLIPEQPVIRKYTRHENKISVVVNDEDYAQLIGKKGANARLIGRMMECEIEVQKMSEYQKILAIHMAELAESEDPSLDEKIKVDGVPGFILEGYVQAGFDTLRKFMLASPQDIVTQVPMGNYYDLAERILKRKKTV